MNSNIDLHDKLKLQVCKMIINVKKNTPTFIVLGERLFPSINPNK